MRGFGPASQNMRFFTTFTPAQLADAQGQPEQTEVMTLKDSQGRTVATFTSTGDGTCAYDVPGPSTQNGVANLTTATGLRSAHAKYDFAVDGGAVGAITPATSDTVPANAIIVGGTINSTTAVTSSGAATVSVGTRLGSAEDSILTATAKASLSANALLNAVPVFAAPVKLTAAGQITVTVATTALTAGVIEVWVYYVVAGA